MLAVVCGELADGVGDIEAEGVIAGETSGTCCRCKGLDVYSWSHCGVSGDW